MYIIVSKQNIENTHHALNALGHEIHISRFIICDMLNKQIINNNDIIVTVSEDRFFLYKNI